MITRTNNPRRIIAVDPGMQYLAVAVLEGEELVRYGVKTFPGSHTLPNIRPQVQQYLTSLLHAYQPEVLVVEDPFYAQSLLSRNLRTLTQDIKTWGRWKKLRVYSYVPPAVKAFFCRDQKTKQSLAEAMVDKYPFLARYLTILPWRRRYWFHVFDAVGLGLMCQRKLARSKISP
jgi:Holliday junction resolvasome RuvABC endonuclease subunit